MSKRNEQGSDTFTCSVDGVTACSKAPQVDILMDSHLWQSIVGLCERFNTEWMAYLIGVKNQDGDYEIKRLSFPEQTAGGAHVHNEPSPDFKVEQDTVGVVHSHVGMQAFFSSTDKAHANWPVEIVVNRKGEYEVSTRVQLPCGEFMRRSSRVMLLTGGQLDSMEATLKEALKKGETREAERRSQSGIVVWDGSRGGGSSYGYGNSGYGQHASDALFRKWRDKTCPICGVSADKCPHAYRDMEAKSLTLFGGRYSKCPICNADPFVCHHTVGEMDTKVDEQEGVAP